MKLSPVEQEQLIALLGKIYVDIAALETPHGLTVGGGDFRPRIDYFHDAVRALAAGDFVRLTVELLTYDVSSLRYLAAMPLSSFHPHEGIRSPSKDIIVTSPGALAARASRPDRATKERLSDLYQYYAILFAALLKPAADADCQDRAEYLQQDAQQLHAIIEALEASSERALQDSIEHLDDNGLRSELQAAIASGKHRRSSEAKKLVSRLKAEIKRKQQMSDRIEQAHLDYGLAQLGVYETGRDVVKKMAESGMNLVGRFVESAISQTRREMGR